jgi:4'-phosphopantetheinyl transferase
VSLIPQRWQPAWDGIAAAALPRGGAPPFLLLIDRDEAAVRAALPALAPLLAQEERQRWQRLRQDQDRERFLLGRAVLRLVLGGIEARPAGSLRFGQGQCGKPHLAGPGTSGTHFNVSHSGALVLLGFHASHPVGVDVERQRPGLDWRAIARRCLPVTQREALAALPGDRQADAFLRAWCRLEARLKARGLGLAALEEAGDEREGETDLWGVALPAGYAGAAALARRGHGAVGPA